MAELVTIARPYADALFELSEAAKTMDDWSIDLEFLLASYQTEQMQNFLKNAEGNRSLFQTDIKIFNLKTFF